MNLKQNEQSLNCHRRKWQNCLIFHLCSYSNLEHGNSFCSAVSLINYVNNCNVDKDKLFAEFGKIIKNTEKN